MRSLEDRVTRLESELFNQQRESQRFAAAIEPLALAVDALAQGLRDLGLDLGEIKDQLGGEQLLRDVAGVRADLAEIRSQLTKLQRT